MAEQTQNGEGETPPSRTEQNVLMRNPGFTAAAVLSFILIILSIFPNLDAKIIGLFVSETTIDTLPNINDAENLNTAIVSYLKSYSTGIALIFFKLFLVVLGLLSLLLDVQKKRIERVVENEHLKSISGHKANIGGAVDPIGNSVGKIRPVVSGLHTKMNEVHEGLTKNKKTETVKIGIFSELLAYAPFFVADEFGYFGDEGLKIEVVSVGNDLSVANGVRDKAYDFGICDPVFALEKIESPDRKLRILTPVAKRLDVSAICEKGLIDKIKLGTSGKVTIACYSKPSTTYCVAQQLLKELTALGVQVKIREIDSDAPEFQNSANIAKLILQNTISLLWNPASSWAYEHISKNHKGKYGILSCTGTSPIIRENIENWSVNDIVLDEHGNPTLSLPDKLPWTAILTDNKNPLVAFKLMAAAILVTDEFSKTRPDLCSRIFKAHARALSRINGAQWGVEEKHFTESTGTPDLITAISNRVLAGSGVDRSVIENLMNAKRMLNRLFPFIDGVKNYSPKDYYKHLNHLHILWWENKDDKLELRKPHTTMREYKRYFVPLASNV